LSPPSFSRVFKNPRQARVVFYNLSSARTQSAGVSTIPEKIQEVAGLHWASPSAYSG